MKHDRPARGNSVRSSTGEVTHSHAGWIDKSRAVGRAATCTSHRGGGGHGVRASLPERAAEIVGAFPRPLSTRSLLMLWALPVFPPPPQTGLPPPRPPSCCPRPRRP